ncbi:MAG: hypothetical protein HYV65_00710 [Candidatus Spechtbacteria bacterium]|nr:hypothetical protein [Candidatus Spechtbacteria bacterium]
MNLTIIFAVAALACLIFIYGFFYTPKLRAQRKAKKQQAKKLEEEIRSQKAAAKLRAWQMLEPMLTPKQLLQKEKYGYILEKGSWGYYLIPMKRITVLFQSYSTTEALKQRMNAYETGRITQYAARAERCSICLNDTGCEAPWYDAVATFLYTIRGGDEVVIFEKGVVLSLSFLTDNYSNILNLLSEALASATEQRSDQ